MAKVISAVYPDHITAQRVVQDVIESDIIGRHLLKITSLDAHNTGGKTRVTASGLLGKEVKAVKAVLEKWNPTEFNDKG